MLRFSGAGVSEAGLVRAANEDSAFVGPYLAVVADGVGGAAAGEIASATATHAVASTVQAGFGGRPEALLREGAEAARVSVQRGVQTDLTRLGMAPRSPRSSATAGASCSGTWETLAPICSTTGAWCSCLVTTPMCSA